MTEIAPILEFIHPTAVPIVVTILGLAFIYRKILSDRNATKIERDKDSESIHDTLLSHTFEIGRIKDNQALHNEVLNDLRDQVSILNSNISKLTAQLEMLCSSWNKK